MFDRIVLGFLMEKDMTGYDVKQTMKNSTNFFFNTSFGNIYPTLKKLEASGFATSTETIRNGKLNKVYSITEEGKQAFLQWLGTDSKIAMIRDEALCRAYFFSHLENDRIESLITSYLDKLDNEIETLTKLKNTHCEIDHWKLKALNFGIEYYTHMKKSYLNMLDRGPR